MSTICNNNIHVHVKLTAERIASFNILNTFLFLVLHHQTSITATACTLASLGDSKVTHINSLLEYQYISVLVLC